MPSFSSDITVARSLGWLSGVALLTPMGAIAQSITAAPDGLGTVVNSQAGLYQIEGGQQSGANLLHSFQTFGLTASETAQFLPQSGIENIIGRVVGGQPSLINGLLQVQNSSANLYLMNPSGVLFGPQGQLDLAGSFTATTATGIGVDDQWFTLTSPAETAALIGTPNQFLFTTASPSSIVNQGQLQVQPGQSLTLAGGSVLNTGTLSAPGGEVTLAAVPRAGVIRLEQPGLVMGLDLNSTAIAHLLDTQGYIPQTHIADLLTGSSGASANQVQVNADGTVQLVATGTPLPTAPGAIASAGTLSVGAAAGGTLGLYGEAIALPTGLIDVRQSGTLNIRAIADLTLGTEVWSSPDSLLYFDPATFVIDLAEANSLVSALAGGGTVIVEASDSITVNAPINSSAQANLATLRFADENSDGTLTINLNQSIRLGANQTLIGEGSLVNVGAAASIQNGIDVAATDAVVNLAATTYRPGQVLNVTRSLTVQGQGIDTTVISGDGDGDGIGDHRVLQALGGNLNINVAGLTIADGRAPQGGGLYANDVNLAIANAAFRNNQAVGLPGVAATVPSGGTVSSSGGIAQGGGLYQGGGTLQISNTEFTSNLALGGAAGTAIAPAQSFARSVGGNAQGGGLYYSGTRAVTIAASTFANNQAIGGNGNQATASLLAESVGGEAEGAGAYVNVDDAAVSLTQLQFAANQARAGQANTATSPTGTASSRGGNAWGGGLLLDFRSQTGAIAQVQDSVLSNNQAVGGTAATATGTTAVSQGGNARGGGLASENRSSTADSVLQVQRSTIAANLVQGGNGSVAMGTSSANASGGNGEGGGWYTLNQPIYGPSFAGGRSLTQGELITVSGNTSRGGSGGTLGLARGGGIWANTPSVTPGDGQFRLSRSTITQNVANTGGGLGGFGDTVTLGSSIVANNQGLLSSPDVSAPVQDLGFNLIGNGEGSTGFTLSPLVGNAAAPINPQLSGLGNFGGLTPTHRLNAGSPALEAADPSLTAPDQRGMAIANQPDIGAYERGAVANLTVLEGNNQTTVVNNRFAQPAAIAVTDRLGGSLDGVAVTFTGPATGAAAVFETGTTVFTTATGLARTGPIRANTTAGSYTVVADANGVQQGLSFTNQPDLPNRLVAIAGNSQSTPVTQAFATDIQIQVTDQYGNPVPGVTVTLAAPTTGASASFSGLTNQSLTTAANGIATATPLTANTVAGAFNLTASVMGLTPLALDLSNLAGAATTLSPIAGNNQSAVVATTFATPLQVQVTDAFGNPVSGVNVVLTAASAGASGQFGGNSTLALITDRTGVATASPFTANTVAGTYAIAATATGLPGTTFSLTNVPDAPATVTAIAGANQSTVVNTAFTDNLAVQVRDRYGNLVPNATVRFSAPGTGASAQFNGQPQISIGTTATGTAIAPTLVANGEAGTFTVLAELASGSTGFTLTNQPLPPSPDQPVSPTVPTTPIDPTSPTAPTAPQPPNLPPPEPEVNPGGDPVRDPAPPSPPRPELNPEAGEPRSPETLALTPTDIFGGTFSDDQPKLEVASIALAEFQNDCPEDALADLEVESDQPSPLSLAELARCGQPLLEVEAALETTSDVGRAGRDRDGDGELDAQQPPHLQPSNDLFIP